MHPENISVKVFSNDDVDDTMVIEKTMFCGQDCTSVFVKYLGEEFDPEAAFAEVAQENDGRVVFAVIVEWLLHKYIEKELARIREEKEREEIEEEEI